MQADCSDSEASGTPGLLTSQSEFLWTRQGAVGAVGGVLRLLTPLSH